jgi:bacterioferritin
MGTKGKAILEIDVKTVTDLLNKAFADEWLAYYQYWLGAKLAEGPMKSAIITELEEHATDELRHAQILADRIMQLGGTPILNPQEWHTMSSCGYLPPQDPNVKTLLKQNIKAEQCAIDVYNKLMKETKDKDVITYNISLQILEDEVEHEEDLEALLQDLNFIK